MKCAIVYFSSTGITSRYAKEITKGLAKNNADTEFQFIRLKKGKIIDLSTYDIIGVGAPSYSFRAPRLATRLLRKIDFNNKPFFVFCTYNSIAGNVLWNLYRSVKSTAGQCLGYKQQGTTVNIRAWKPKNDSPKKLKKITEEALEKARQFGLEIWKRYEQLKQNQETNQVKEWIPPKKIILQIWALFLTWECEMMFTVGFKRVDKKKCTKCELCVTTICPSGAIKLTKEKWPKFIEIYCVGCNGCVNLCPTDAIWTYQTRNKKQYNLYKEFILKEIPKNELT